MKAKKLIEKLSKDPEAEILVWTDHGQENTRAHYINYSPFIDYGGEIDIYDEDWSAYEANMEEKEWEETKKNRIWVIS